MPIIDLMFSFDSLNNILLSGYLDPGTGSYALQLLLASVFGGLFVLKQSWQQVRERLSLLLPARRLPSAPLDGGD